MDARGSRPPPIGLEDVALEKLDKAIARAAIAPGVSDQMRMDVVVASISLQRFVHSHPFVLLPAREVANC